MIKQLPPIITSILECAPEPVGIFDTNFRYIYFNRHHVEEVRNVFGIRCYSGISLSEILEKDPNTFEVVKKIWQKVLDGGSETFTHELGFGDHRTIYEVKYAPVRDVAGVIVGGVHWAKNLTMKLIQSEEDFRSTFDLAAVGLGHADLEGKWLRVNRCFSEILGYTNEQLQTLNFFDITHPDDKAKCRTSYENLLSGVVETITEEKRYIHKKGHAVWVSISATIKKNEAGLPEYFIISVNDIDKLKKYQTALTESEKRFKHLADNLPQIIYTLDQDGAKCDYCNERWYEFTGLPYEPDNWSLGWQTVIHPDDLKTMVDSWRISLAEGKPYSAEFRLLNVNTREYRWFLSRTIPVKDRHNKTLRWVGTSTDIHEQKMITENLQKNLRVRDEFLALSSHALKTPITSLYMSTQMLKLFHGKKISELPEGLKILNSIDQIEIQISRLTKLIDDMLDITKIRAGNLSLNIEPTDLGQLTREIVERLRPQILSSCRNREPLVKLEKVEGHWDKLRIEQVLTNLLTNALRYGGGNGIEITVRAERDIAYLSVKDYGIGIAREDQERIFERFERAISASEISGLGLGLFIVKKIVEAHHGKIHLKSKPERGSEFIIELPRTIEIISEAGNGT